MTSRARFGAFQRELLDSLHFDIRGASKKYRWVIWLLSATVSLLSTRNLLIERYLHYPKQLYVIQLAGTVFIVLCLHSWPHKSQRASEHEGHARSVCKRRSFLVNLQFFIIAQSMLCTMQAILHFTNFPVLIMITSIAFFTEGLLLLILSLVRYSQAEFFRLSMMLLASVGILVAEYRLGVQNLLASILAMLCAGVAGALGKLVAKRYPQDSFNFKSEPMQFVGMGAVAAVAWVVFPGAKEQLMVFDSRHIPLLVINALSTGSAMLLGGSILFPTNLYSGNESSQTTFAPSQNVRDAFMLLFLAGVVGCVSSLHVRRPYISWYQFWFFVLALVFIGCEIGQNRFRRSDLHEGHVSNTYELVAQPMFSQSHSSNSTITIDDFDATQSQSRLSNNRDSIKSHIVLAGIIIVIWTAYSFLNFDPQSRLQIDTKLDQKYTSKMPLEVIISMFKEPVEDVAQAISHMKAQPTFQEAVFTIYVKSEQTNAHQLKEKSGANSVLVLPNIGREGGTYLHHIIERWDSLAKQTVFLQAEIHNPREFWPRLNNYFVPKKTGFLSLGWSGGVCHRDSCSDRYYWQDETQLFPDIQRRINSADQSREILLSYKGQFVVSAARIRGIDKGIYEDLWDAFANESSWAHQDEYIRGRKDSLSAPLFGYTVERIWNLLFQCSNMDIAWKCPTLLSQWRAGGNVGDCQCWD